LKESLLNLEKIADDENRKRQGLQHLYENIKNEFDTMKDHFDTVKNLKTEIDGPKYKIINTLLALQEKYESTVNTLNKQKK